MSDETGTTSTTRRRPAKAKGEDATIDKVVDTTVVENPNAPAWAAGFADEDYPDALSPSAGEELYFEVIGSDIIPIESKQERGKMVDTEAVQVMVMLGSTVTEQEQNEDGEYVSTGEVIPVGEVRTLWINSQLLRDIWAKWDVQVGDEGALVYKGHVPPKRGGTPYQKWIGKFNKSIPRQSTTR